MEKKITKIEKTRDGLGYMITFSDNSKVYISKHHDLGMPYSKDVKIIYKGKEYEI